MKSPLTREALGWTAAPFVIPADVYAAWDARPPVRRRGRLGERFAAYKAAFPSWPPNWRAAWRRAAAGLCADGVGGGGRAHQGRDRGQPQGQPDRAGGFTRRCPSCWAARPT
jgi:hypothetical protein